MISRTTISVYQSKPKLDKNMFSCCKITLLLDSENWEKDRGLYGGDNLVLVIPDLLAIKVEFNTTISFNGDQIM